MADDTTAGDTPGVPEEPAPAAPGSGPRGGAVAVPRWAVGLLVAVLVIGVGFAVGRITAPENSHDNAKEATAVVPRGLDKLGNTLRKRLQQCMNDPGNCAFGLGPRNPTNPTTPTAPGTANRAFLGVSVQAASGQSGALVQAVSSGSPADRAGIQVGDVITAVDANAVSGPADLAARIQAHQPGDAVTLRVTRGGSSMDVRVTLTSVSVGSAAGGERPRGG